MSKFNSFAKGSKTENLAGGEAYKESTKLEFVSILLTSFIQNQYYRSENDTIERIRELIKNEKDKKFVAKASLYARNEFGMRSVSHVVAGEIAKNVKKETWTKNYFDKIVYRVDDMAEILSYYSGINKGLHPVPNALLKGFKKAFNKFDEYQLGKYRGEKKEISLVDIVNLIRPKPNKKNKEALKKLVNGELKSKNTWESQLTQAGQKAESKEEKEKLKKDVWVNLIKEKKIGYFALLKNLKNILEQAPEIIDEAIVFLTDEKLIKKSLVLPFRFFTAIKEIESLPDSRKIIIGLGKAAEISLNNVPEFPGKTLIAVDVSGSMRGRPEEIARMFGSILYKRNDADLLTFEDYSRFYSLNPLDNLLSLMKQIDFFGGGTNFHSIFDSLKKKYDRIIILSDMQAWMDNGYSSSNPISSFNDYKKRTGANPLIYSFDLQGYGTLQFPERNIYCLAGFSDKIFDIMKLLEQDKNALINKIEAIEL